jgi:tetratricopeptide (TPR) repeat protein
MRSRVLPGAALAAILFAAGCRTAPPLEQGLSLSRHGAWAAAVVAFDEAIRLDPRSESAYTSRGAARLHLGDATGAVEDFTRALELNPKQPETLFFNRANAYAFAGENAAALADFTRAVEIRPDFSRAFFNRGLVRARSGDLAGARADWEQAIALEPDLRIRAAMARQAERTSWAGPSAPEPPVPSAAATPSSLEPTPAVGTGSPVATPGEASPPLASPAPHPASPEPPIDARTLANRGIHRELAGDHEGALADLRAALQLEKDPARRAGIESLLRLLEPKQ